MLPTHSLYAKFITKLEKKQLTCKRLALLGLSLGLTIRRCRQGKKKHTRCLWVPKYFSEEKKQSEWENLFSELSEDGKE